MFNIPPTHPISSGLRPEGWSHSIVFPWLQKVASVIHKFLVSAPKNPTIALKKEVQEQQLLKSSLLEKPLDKNVLPEFSPNDVWTSDFGKLVGAILGEEVISESAFECVTTLSSAEAFLKMLSLYEASGKPLPEKWSVLKSHLTQYGETTKELAALRSPGIEKSAERFHGEATRIGSIVYNLSPGESFLMEAGVDNEKGKEEGALFEFLKNHDGTHDVFVYSAGVGAAQYQTLLYLDRKTQLRPLIHYKNVPKEVLFFEDEKQKAQFDFFQVLLETKFLSRKKNLGYLVMDVCILLHPYRVPANQETIGFISSAKGRTDNWRALKAYAFNFLDRTTYKDLMITIKFQTLRESYLKTKEQLSADSLPSAQLRLFLKEGAHQILRALAKKTDFTALETTQMRATANDLLKKLHAIENQIAEERKNVAKVVFLSLDQTENASSKSKASLTHNQQHIAQGERVIYANDWGSVNFSVLPESQHLAKFLTDFNINSDPLCAASEIDHIVSQFSIPKQGIDIFWDSIPPNDLPQVSSSLEKILNGYDKATRQKAVFPHQTNTVYTIYIILHYLALRIERGKSSGKVLENYPLCFPDTLDKDPYCVFFDPKDFDRREEILSYFKFLYEQNKNLGYRYGLDESGGFGMKWIKNGEIPEPLFNFSNYRSLDSTKLNYGDYKFYKELLNAHPGLRSSASGKITHEHDLSQEVREVAGLVAYPSLLRGELAYLASLRQAAVIAHQFGTQKELRQCATGEITVEYNVFVNKEMKTTQVSFNFKVDNQKIESQPSWSMNLHASLHPEFRDFLEDHDMVTGRFISITNEPTEGRILGKKGFSGRQLSRFPAKEMLRSGCEPSLQPYHLIALYRTTALDALERSNEQVLFELQFFKSVGFEDAALIDYRRNTERENELLRTNYLYFTRKRKHILRDELTSQKSLVENAKVFIQEGIDQYYLRQPGQRPNVFACTFFVRLATRLRHILKDSPSEKEIPECHNYLLSMLRREDLTSEEKSCLALHLLHTFIDVPLDSMEPTLIQNILQHWVYYKNHPLQAAWKQPTIEKAVEEMILRLQSSFVVLSQQMKLDLAQTLLSSLDVEGAFGKAEIVEGSLSRTIHVAFPNEEWWKIDLVTGIVSNRSGILREYLNPSWEQEDVSDSELVGRKLFQRFFGNKKYCYKQTGSIIHFSDPVLGQFRVFNQKLSTGLQRKIGDQWYQFLLPKLLENSGIPGAFFCDQTHWLSLDLENPTLLICSSPDGKVVARVDKTGKASAPGKPEYFSWTEMFSQFDEPGYTILHYRDQEQAPFAMHFDRYRSLDKTPLYFDLKDNKMIWRDNQKYYLASLQTAGLVGTLPNYLLLNQLDGKKQKLLIPQLPIRDAQILSQPLSLEIPMGRPYQHEQGRYCFLEFDLKNGKIEALNAEGNLYLAYLYLAHRDYHTALRYLKKVEPVNPLSANSSKILSVSPDFLSSEVVWRDL